MEFTNPIRITDWEPPFTAAVYAITVPTEKAGRFRLVYIGESGDDSAMGFFTDHPKYPCWLEQAGSEESIFVGLHLMPDSTQEERRKVEAEAIGSLDLVCQSDEARQPVSDKEERRALATEELESARERKRLSEERARQYHLKIRKAEAEVADFRKELTLGQQRLRELQRQKGELDKRVSDLNNGITSANQAVTRLQRKIDAHKQTIAADHAEMEKYNMEVQRLDHVIADLMRRR